MCDLHATSSCTLLPEAVIDPDLTDMGMLQGKIDATVAELKAKGIRSVGILADVTKAADCKRCAALLQQCSLHPCRL